tara:strand:+ start:264 stop:563 length:300 start_codon:yes stop_codon:yes gene_type:complete
MEITEIHNYSFETQHEILEVEYSIQDDPQDTYREISLSKEEFNEYYTFGEIMEMYDIDDVEDTHYELGTDFEFDEENLKNALAEYLTLYEDELSDINHY